jgi:hypothetical protein
MDGQLQSAITTALENLERVDTLRRQADAHPFMMQGARAELADCIDVKGDQTVAGLWIRRKNEFLGRWMKHGGFWPDPKLRLFRRGCGRFEDRAVHETLQVKGATASLKHGALLHHCYPTVSDYIAHMNRYSSLGAEMAVAEGRTGFSVINIAVRPLVTFVYNYFFRLGFLDGREGLLHAPLPRGVRLLEIREGLGTGARAQILTCPGAIRYRTLRSGQHGTHPVRVTDVEQHAFRYHASHLARLQVYDEQRLPAHNLLRIGTFCFHSGNDGAFVIAEAHAQLNQLVGVWHIVHCEDRPDPNVNLIQDFQRNRWLDGAGIVTR